jgi:hypothetical protein
MASDWTLVLYGGKPLAKTTLWDEAARRVASRSRPNRPPNAGARLTWGAASEAFQ